MQTNVNGGPFTGYGFKVLTGWPRSDRQLAAGRVRS